MRRLERRSFVVPRASTKFALHQGAQIAERRGRRDSERRGIVAHRERADVCRARADNTALAAVASRFCSGTLYGASKPAP
jgi:hypothetical protein